MYCYTKSITYTHTHMHVIVYSFPAVGAHSASFLPRSGQHSIIPASARRSSARRRRRNHSSHNSFLRRLTLLAASEIAKRRSQSSVASVGLCMYNRHISKSHLFHKGFTLFSHLPECKSVLCEQGDKHGKPVFRYACLHILHSFMYMQV